MDLRAEVHFGVCCDVTAPARISNHAEVQRRVASDFSRSPTTIDQDMTGQPTGGMFPLGWPPASDCLPADSSLPFSRLARVTCSEARLPQQ